MTAARPDVAELDAELRAVEAELATAGGGRRSRSDGPGAHPSAGAVGAVGRGRRARARRSRRGRCSPRSVSTATISDCPTNALSGGQRKLVALAACLIRQPDLLLLDEPETHLDADRRARLEAIVGEFPGAVVTVSHDRYLLDETVSRVAELDGGMVTMWPGNYSAYAVAKEIALKRQQQLYVTQQKEIARLEEAIARFKDWARPRREQASHQAGAQQAATDRPHGQDRQAGLRAAEDRARDAQRRAGRQQDRRTPRRDRRVRRRARAARVLRAGVPRRAGRRDRRERRRQVGARHRARRAARSRRG